MSTTWDHSPNEAPLWGVPRRIDGLWRWESRAFNPYSHPVCTICLDVWPSEEEPGRMEQGGYLLSGGNSGWPGALDFESMCFAFGRAGVRPECGEWHYFGPGSTREANPWVWPRPIVYFIRDDDHEGAIKIGYSADANRRFWELQPTSPRQLTVILWLDGTRGLEAELHRTFARERMRGEWFEPSERILSFVESNRGYAIRGPIR